eukprot:TRINITY_DN5478_c0_g1_i1.p1 TRINITY_DN5478_c0_g1~~TRINITY_DN5478_c0_g1_i1.p1  ORF type:complete len:209 (+),score=27.32 TRINITY_DN5478_c0_g1_i1:98-724(+)
MLAPSKAYATLNPHPHHHAHLVAPPLPTTHDAVAHHHNAVLLQLDPPHTGLDALQARADDHHLPLVPTHHVTDDVHHQHLAPSEHHPHEEDEDNPHTHHHHAHHHAQLSALEDQHHLTHLGQSPDDAVGQETLEPLPPITEVDPLSGKTFSREMAAMYSAGMVYHLFFFLCACLWDSLSSSSTQGTSCTSHLGTYVHADTQHQPRYDR